MNQDIIFFDVETSGLDPKENEIIEMAAIRVDPTGSVVAQYSDKIRPTKPVGEKAAKINRYSEEAWKDSIPFKTALNTLKSSVLHNRPESFIVVAHYGQFDQMFLNAECARIEEKVPFDGRKWIDTFHLSWPLLVAGAIESQSLTSLGKYFGVPLDRAHTALGDVEILCCVYDRLMKRYMLITEAEGAIRGIGKSIMEKGIELIGGSSVESK